MQKEFDIIIAGAGSAGCSAAIAAGQAGFSVLLLDGKTQESIGDKACGDCMRGSEERWIREVLDTDISPSVLARNMGIRLLQTNRMHSVRVPPHIADKITVDRPSFGQILLNKALSYPKVQLLAGTRAKSLLQNKKAVMGIETSKGERYYSAVVLDASGATSSLRAQVSQVDTLLEKNIAKEDQAFAWREVFTVDDELEYNEDTLALFEKTDSLGGYIWYFPLGDKRWNAGVGGTAFPITSWQKIMNKDLIKHGAQKRHTIRQAGAFLPARHYSTCPVANGYIALGDAAFAVGPTDGAGIQASMITGVLAVERLIELRSKNLAFNEENLFPITRRYYTYNYKGVNWDHGAGVSSLIALKTTVQNLSEEDFDFLVGALHEEFLMDIYDIKLKNACSLLISLARLIKKPKLCTTLAKALWNQAKLKKHFLKIPENRNALPQWREELQILLQKIPLLEGRN